MYFVPFVEEDLKNILRYNGQEKEFINNYDKESLKILKENLVNSTAVLIKKIYQKKDNLNSESSKKEIIKIITKVGKTFKASFNFDYQNWFSKKKPSDFSQMHASEFKLNNLTETFNTLLSIFKMSYAHSSDEYINETRIKDREIIRSILVDYNECFKKIGIFGLSYEETKQILYFKKEGVDPIDCGFESFKYMDDSDDFFRVYNFPFFIKYPFYRSIDEKLVKYYNFPLNLGVVYYNERQLDDHLNKNNSEKK